VQHRLFVLAGVGLIAVFAAVGVAKLRAQDQFPPVPPGGFAPNGQQLGGQPQGYYPGAGVQPYNVPYQPTAPTRPNTFPGGPVPPIATAPGINGPNGPGPNVPVQPGSFIPANYVGPPFLPGAQVPPPQLCQAAIIVARVGNDVVLTSDLSTAIDEMIGNAMGKVPPQKFREQRAKMLKDLREAIADLAAHEKDPDPVKGLDPAHASYLYGTLRREIEIKLLYLDFSKTVPKEALPSIEEQVEKRFEESQIKTLMERENASTRADLETNLRAEGSSLEREKRIYREQCLGQMWRLEQVNNKKDQDKEVTHEEMLKWYQEHITLFETQPQVRWEELMTSFTRHQDRNEAYRLLAGLGNRVLAGATFSDVAKNGSEGPTALLGGQRDWTHKGTLSSTVLENAIFALPVNQLSEILMSQDGYHIVRVVERQEYVRKSFLEVQKQIKESVKNERLENRYKAFLDKLREKYPVWTVFDNALQQPPTPAADDDDRYSRK
jgi:hypothetical protein